jgi:hypothetical protein
MAAAGLSLPPCVCGAWANGGPSLLMAAAVRLRRSSRSTSSGGGGTTLDLAWPGWIWSTARGRGRSPVLSPPCHRWSGVSWEQATSSSFAVVAFVSFLHRSWGSLDELAAWFVRAVTASLRGCRPSLARRCRQPQWWGRLRVDDGVLLFVVTCSGLAVFLASTAYGETTRRLLS